MNPVIESRMAPRAIGPRRSAAAAALLGMAACGTFDHPSASEAPLQLDGHEVVVSSLDCAPDGAVVAAGWIDPDRRLEGVVLHSADRGATWRRAALDPAAAGVTLSLVRMPGERATRALHASGYRVGTSLFGGQMASSYPPGPWWVTQDGGASWRQATAPMPLRPTRDIERRVPRVLAADAAGTLVAVQDHPEPGLLGSDRVALLRSTDGGASWSEQVLPQLNYDGSIVTDGRGRLVMAGVARETGAILWSGDSGSSWSQGRVPDPVTRNLRVHRNPDGTLIAFNVEDMSWHGMSTHLYRSVDGGRNWAAPNVFRLGRIVAMAGNARGRVVALSTSGAVLLSDDAGATWRGATNRTLPRTDIAESLMIAFDDGVIVATLDRGRLIRSTDWGQNWSPVDSGLPEHQYVLTEHCVDGRGLIVLAGSGGMVTRSIDRGATWTAGRMAPPQGR